MLAAGPLLMRSLLVASQDTASSPSALSTLRAAITGQTLRAGMSFTENPQTRTAFCSARWGLASLQTANGLWLTQTCGIMNLT